MKNKKINNTTVKVKENLLLVTFRLSCKIVVLFIAEILLKPETLIICLNQKLLTKLSTDGHPEEWTDIANLLHKLLEQSGQQN